MVEEYRNSGILSICHISSVLNSYILHENFSKVSQNNNDKSAAVHIFCELFKVIAICGTLHGTSTNLLQNDYY